MRRRPLGSFMQSDLRFTDRVQAGRRLAEHMRTMDLGGDDVVVLGLPRGGVPVAAEVAAALDAPLDVIVVRKLGVPFQPELAMGAIGEDGVRVVNNDIVRMANVTEREMAEVEAAERIELDRRARRFRGERPRLDVTGRTVLIVDDGIATGSTAKAACQVARAHGAGRVILAVPVAPPDVAARFAVDADAIEVLATPESFYAVGQFYDDFSQTTDDEVVHLLAEAATRWKNRTVSSLGDDPPMRSEDVEIDIGTAVLRGHLEIPDDPLGIVVFAHGSGSSSHSPRNRFVASVLNEAGIGTLLFDLLTTDEELNRANVFDVDLLARRLTDATLWLRSQPEAVGLPIGYFGASTGAAGARGGASEPGANVAAVVSRGGRPDLAGPRLGSVLAPTLLIVGGDDTVVIGLNRLAQEELPAGTELAIIPGATHLFEEPGTLRQAAETARDWFHHHLLDAGLQAS
jgi:putative phosphoribosyl transferase